MIKYIYGGIMKKFTQRDEEFICENCNKKVNKLLYTSRDHCPYCLYSKHVDINPGDRLNTCLGLLKPIGIEKYKKTYKIIYKCERCNTIHKNIIANDDNMDKIIDLSVESN
jgi:Zn finger protein HypA/HybF involved in hydrogenase expression